MMRLLVLVEGQTEEVFVKDVLAPHLVRFGVYAAATTVGKVHAQRAGQQRRGGGHFRHWRNDLLRLLGNRQDAGVRVTTLFDLYGLPEDFPNLQRWNAVTDSNARCDGLQAEIAALADDRRVLPYIQRHEFEALVLASLDALEDWLDADADLAGLAALRHEIAALAPEDVNHGPETAPSKRLLAHIPGYSKTLHGPLAIAGRTLAQIRGVCPRFDAWLTTLEGLAGAQGMS
ncbi:MAG: DUF4276 family protein [Deltaproteobacteria bacterium]|nr:DUF4276 family protein [Deltaproteobacteria bacterium]